MSVPLYTLIYIVRNSGLRWYSALLEGGAGEKREATGGRRESESRRILGVSRFGENKDSLKANKATHEGNTMELVLGKFERLVFGVIGNDKDMVVVRSSPDPLDERSLHSVEDVGFVPLKENIAERYPLTGHEIARIIRGLHRISLDLYKEISPFESRNNITLAFILHDGRFSSESSSHCAKRNKGDSLVITLHGDKSLLFLQITLILIIFIP